MSRLALAAVVVSAALAGCGGAGDKTFEQDQFSFTFEYPGDFEETAEIDIGAAAGGTSVAREGIGLDDDNLIIVTRYDLRATVTKANLSRIKPELDEVVGEVAGAELSGTETEAGGLPGYEYEFDVSDPENGRSRFVALFDGDVEYTLNCQSTPDKRDEVEAACQQALATLRTK